jgi:hypothetical protein
MLLVPKTDILLVLRVHGRPSLTLLDTDIFIQTRFVGQLTIVSLRANVNAEVEASEGANATSECCSAAGGCGAGMRKEWKWMGLNARTRFGSRALQHLVASASLPAASVITTKCSNVMSVVMALAAILC